jgi:hypothetical protein
MPSPKGLCCVDAVSLQMLEKLNKMLQYAHAIFTAILLYYGGVLRCELRCCRYRLCVKIRERRRSYKFPKLFDRHNGPVSGDEGGRWSIR